MALRTINYTLDVSDISPKACQYGGIQGEDNVTDIVFTFSTALVTALNTARGSLTLAYRIDGMDSAGGYYSSELLTYNGTNNTITFTIPQALTITSGICVLHLVISLLDSNNVEQQILYSYSVSIRIGASSYGGSPEAAYKREISGALLQVETSATNAATSAYRDLASALDLKADKTDSLKLVTGTYATRPTSVSRPTIYLSTDVAYGNANRITISTDGITWYQV